MNLQELKNRLECRSMCETIGFFYLKTGGGHASGANSLKDKISSIYPEAKCVMYDPFAKKAFLSSLFFETGYFITSNYFPRCYLLFYRLTSYKIVLRFARFAYRNFFVRRFVRFFKNEKVTRVVCLHEILVPHLREAIDIVDPSIKLITVVMDPFTAHHSWFFEKNTHLVVFSSKLEKEAIEKYNFEKHNVHKFSFMLSDKFNLPYSMEEKRKIREDFGIPLDSKVVLIAGGGEGLHNALRLVLIFLRRKFKGHVLVVCGKNKKLKRIIDMAVAHYQASNIHVFGFVSFMPELMNIADCVISKSGPATIIETLSLQKPLILSSYVRGQELGNMLFVKLNKVGYYLPSSYNAVVKTEEILSISMEKIRKNIKQLNIKNGIEDVARFIMTI